jgi:hypothetical protein
MQNSACQSFIPVISRGEFLANSSPAQSAGLLFAPGLQVN